MPLLVQLCMELSNFIGIDIHNGKSEANWPCNGTSQLLDFLKLSTATPLTQVSIITTSSISKSLVVDLTVHFV